MVRRRAGVQRRSAARPVDARRSRARPAGHRATRSSLLSIKDATAAQAWFDAAFKEAGATTTTETYGGTTLTVFGRVRRPAGRLRDRRRQGRDRRRRSTRSRPPSTPRATAASPTDPDAKAGPRLGDGDHIGFVYVALKPVVDWATELGSSRIGSDPTACRRPLSEAMLQFLPGLGRLLAARRGRRGRHGGDRRRSPRPSSARPRTARPTSPSTCRRRPSPSPSATTRARPSSRSSTCTRTTPTLKDVTGAHRPGPRRPRRRRQRHRLDRRHRAGREPLRRRRSKAASSSSRPTRRRRPASSPASRTSRRSSGAAGRHVQRTRTTAARPSRSPRIDLAGLDGRRRRDRIFALPVDKIELAWAVTDDLVVIGTGPGVRRSTSSTRPTPRRWPRTTGTRASWTGSGTGTGSLFVDIAADPRAWPRGS